MSIVPASPYPWRAVLEPEHARVEWVILAGDGTTLAVVPRTMIRSPERVMSDVRLMSRAPELALSLWALCLRYPEGPGQEHPATAEGRHARKLLSLLQGTL